MTNDSKANLNQLLLYWNNYQTTIKHERNNYDTYKTIFNTWICCDPTKQSLNQSDHWLKVKLSQSLFYRNKTSSGVALKPPLNLGARFLMYNAFKNSNWDQLEQVFRTQNLHVTYAFQSESTLYSSLNVKFGQMVECSFKN